MMKVWHGIQTMIRKRKTPLLEPGQEILWVMEDGELTMIQGPVPKTVPATGRKKNNVTKFGYKTCKVIDQ